MAAGEVTISKTLEDKLATIMHYHYELRAGRRSKNERMMKSMLDDREVAEWLNKMEHQNRVDFTRFS